MLNRTIGFVGAGQMARALAQGLVRTNLLAERQIVAADPVAAALDEFHHLLPASGSATNNADLAQSCEIIVLAVKPQQAAAALSELRPSMSPDKLVISIVTGVRLAALAEGLGPCRLIRVMPNTPCLVGQSASAYCLGKGATPDDARLIAQLLGAVGLAISVEEKLLDAVTGLSGSGPAFVYLMIEALADGGVRMGLPREVALRLAAQTVKGAAEMVIVTGEHPGLLKDRVASPGGTTIAGLAAIEQHGVRGALIAAVEAAARRATELAGG
ncbi:MAG: pyrroline-5-carboxylate reductase [Pirellulales bacterium]|nr:pyrroline-5-carboxylate reductase [Pirellulales bacterium]